MKVNDTNVMKEIAEDGQTEGDTEEGQSSELDKTIEGESWEGRAEPGHEWNIRKHKNEIKRSKGDGAKRSNRAVNDIKEWRGREKTRDKE